MSEFQCNWCDEYGIHSPACPYIEHPLGDPEGAECGECKEPLVLVSYYNILGDRHTRRVCYDCWDWAGVGAE